MSFGFVFWNLHSRWSINFETRFGNAFLLRIQWWVFLNIDAANLPKDQFFKNHKIFLDSISKFNGVDRDEALKIKAIKNISNNKIKFIKNISNNISRLFFRYPYSYSEKNPLIQSINLILGFLILVFFLTSIKILILKRKQVPNSLFSIFYFLTIYLLGTSLLSANGRFLFPIYPLIIFFIGLIITNHSNIFSIKINKRWKKKF